MKLDDLDLNIIKNLQSDARMSLRDMARKMDVPHTTVFSRVNKLVKKGVIKNFSAVIHPHELGMQLGIIIVDAPPSESKQIATEIARHPEAKKVLRTIDGKVIVKVAVPQTSECRGLEDYLKKLNGTPMTVYPIHDVVKYSNTIHDDLLDNLV